MTDRWMGSYHYSNDYIVFDAKPVLGAAARAGSFGMSLSLSDIYNGEPNKITVQPSYIAVGGIGIIDENNFNLSSVGFGASYSTPLFFDRGYFSAFFGPIFSVDNISIAFRFSFGPQNKPLGSTLRFPAYSVSTNLILLDRSGYQPGTARYGYSDAYRSLNHADLVELTGGDSGRIAEVIGSLIDDINRAANIERAKHIVDHSLEARDERDALRNRTSNVELADARAALSLDARDERVSPEMRPNGASPQPTISRNPYDTQRSPRESSNSGPGSAADARAADRTPGLGRALSKTTPGNTYANEKGNSNKGSDRAAYSGDATGRASQSSSKGSYSSSGATQSGNRSGNSTGYSSGGSGKSSGSNKSGGKDPTRDHSKGGHATAPVLLDLAGNGLNADTLDTSDRFVDFDGDGYLTRTAWSGAGTGVLVIDADGNGKVSRSSEFVFTEWDPTAASDLEALKSAFDTNHNGKLDAGDARWSEFRVEVNGQLQTLAAQNIASIDLTPSGSGQSFADGSAITGTTTFTRTDGSTGAVGDAVLAAEDRSYTVKTVAVTNADGSKTTTTSGFERNGTLAFVNKVTTSADGLSATAQFDDDGNGIFERSQTDVTTLLANGARRRVVSDFHADGSLAGWTSATVRRKARRDRWCFRPESAWIIHADCADVERAPAYQ